MNVPTRPILRLSADGGIAATSSRTVRSVHHQGSAGRVHDHHSNESHTFGIRLVRWMRIQPHDPSQHVRSNCSRCCILLHRGRSEGSFRQLYTIGWDGHGFQGSQPTSGFLDLVKQAGEGPLSFTIDYRHENIENAQKTICPVFFPCGHSVPYP